MDTRLTALLAALLLAMLALAACTGGRDEADPCTATATATPIQTSIPIPAPASAPAGVAADRAILVALYHATGGRDWDESENWLTDVPLGEWYGVTTDSDGRVTELNLIGGLSGPIPPQLGNPARAAGSRKRRAS